MLKKGEKIKTGSPIGKVAENSEGKSVFKFLIFKDETKQNPANWIYKM
jgi:septal ring factor EnvC (AmiA/AmiB activator)